MIDLILLLMFLYCAVAYSCEFDAFSVFNRSAVHSAYLEKSEWSHHINSSDRHFHERNHQPHKTHQAFDLIGPIHPQLCGSPIESFGEGDDEKRFCGLTTIAQHEKSDCVILSIGSNNQWNFEEVIFNRTQCRVETFDCTVKKKAQPPAYIRSRVRLHRICLGTGHDNSSMYVSYSEMLSLAHITNKAPTALKMDIEGWEWPVFKSMFEADRKLKTSFLPIQVAFELHNLHPVKKHVQKVQRAPKEIAFFMDMLWRNGKYFVMDRHDNSLCDGCTELLVARMT
jgi:hypothetical protein